MTLSGQQQQLVKADTQDTGDQGSCPAAHRGHQRCVPTHKSWCGQSTSPQGPAQHPHSVHQLGGCL